jgi:hypothetical protein
LIKIPDKKDEKTIILFDNTCYTVGRQPTCDVVLDDDSISRKHATLRTTCNYQTHLLVVESGFIFVQDLGSLNKVRLKSSSSTDSILELKPHFFYQILPSNIVFFGNVECTLKTSESRMIFFFCFLTFQLLLRWKVRKCMKILQLH